MTTDEHAYPVEVARDVLIPMPDGAHLAATLHRPAADGRWPAIITLMPYHKDGRGGRGSTEAVHHHFARRGYAALTVDLRGLGGSEGLNAYPFDPQERRDGHAAVEWAAGQPWCTGNVGMWGTLLRRHHRAQRRLHPAPAPPYDYPGACVLGYL